MSKKGLEATLDGQQSRDNHHMNKNSNQRIVVEKLDKETGLIGDKGCLKRLLYVCKVAQGEPKRLD